MLNRRTLLTTSLALGGAAMLPFSRAEAQALQSLQIFVPAAPGGGWDGTGRAIEQVMRAEKIMESFQFEHAPGAGGVVGLPKFMSSKKGQPNAVMVGGMVMVGAIIANKAPLKLTDLPPIARLTGEFEAIVVPAASPFKTMKDLVAAFKADPAKVSWAGGSAGGTDHILAGMIAKAVGVDPKKVAYVAFAGGGPAVAALLGNQVSCGVSGYGEFAEQVKAGKLRVLALSADKRQQGIDAPTLKEEGVDVELFNWRGVFGAPGITKEQQAALIGLFDKLNASAGWKAELAKRDWTGIYLSGDGFGKYIESEVTRITGILKDLGLAS
ncbi:MAG: tripartite tricarboxylate transporter substrate binding protein [Hyphomicrobiales bacterium]|uniref:Bug family tripartite tricarboxylate transporter substrate binding protein n=1 Tax=Rhabdaerophilum calidifontis TaxID=2604328 RepID=UPI00123B8EB5|nr:tripartite tricarboxylate transporter substrate-binding protein [Rhabdaerophilum calidifontis]MCA1951981.1 tripartite tricarboxylate transporter substrate binding protein [Hyphomicrobiales bacterium]MCA1998715.1 tripartite tricarboxylate transporter substrate binding protein [Hyphomicrobiales bacterium]